MNALSAEHSKKEGGRGVAGGGPQGPLCKVAVRDTFLGVNCFLVRNGF